jgi:hypothetical protein
MIPQINIRQTLGQIGLRYEPQQWTVSSPPDQLTIQNSRVDLNIQTTPGQLLIDQSQAFADEGLRSPLAFSQYESSRAVQTAEHGTASNADWGQRFMHIEKGDPMKQYVSRDEDKSVALVPALVPSPFSVKTSYQPGKLSIQVNVTPVKVSETTQPVQVSLTPTKVDAYLAQQPQLQIITPPVGQLIDSHV